MHKSIIVILIITMACLFACGEAVPVVETEAMTTTEITTTTKIETTTEAETVTTTMPVTTTQAITTTKKLTTTARKPREVKLSTVEEAQAFFNRGEFTLRGRQGNKPIELVVLNGNFWMVNAIYSVLQTPDGLFELDIENKQYRRLSSEADKLAFVRLVPWFWLGADIPPGIIITETGTYSRGELQGIEFRAERFRIDSDYSRGYTGEIIYIFEEDTLRSINYNPRAPFSRDFGPLGLEGLHLAAIDSITDTADPALFSLEGYEEVAQLGR